MCARFCNENSRHRSRFSRELTFLVMAFFGGRHLRCSEYFWGKILAMFYEAHQKMRKIPALVQKETSIIGRSSVSFFFNYMRVEEYLNEFICLCFNKVLLLL